MFLSAALAASALSLSACAGPDPGAERVPTGAAPKPTTPPAPPTTAPPVAEEPETAEPPVPEEPPVRQYTPQFDAPYGPLNSLPPEVGNRFAWTVDDGASPDVVMSYAQFAQRTGHRITFFVNGMYADSWVAAAPVLAPMIASGQVQIASHTFSHPSLTSIGDAQIQDDLMANHAFIEQTFGIDARPWYRPPYGNRDARTDAAAAAVGYTTPVMWNGSIGDSGLIPPAVLLQEAERWIQPAGIVLGHANAQTVVDLFDHLIDIINRKGLESVTLNDVFRTA